MIEQATLQNVLTCVIAAIIFIFQLLNHFIAWIKNYVKREYFRLKILLNNNIFIKQIIHYIFFLNSFIKNMYFYLT